MGPTGSHTDASLTAMLCQGHSELRGAVKRLVRDPGGRPHRRNALLSRFGRSASSRVALEHRVRCAPIQEALNAAQSVGRTRGSSSVRE